MFKIESRDLITAESRLLFNIQELLIELNKNLKPVVKEKTYICKTCKEVYTNIGDMLVCARKHKKEGAK